MITQLMKDNITAVIRKNIDDANAYYNINMKMPKVDFSLRGQCAGRAFFNNWTIKINTVLLSENETQMTNVTVPHEVAHLVDFKVNPENFESKWLTGRKRSLHGSTFKFILGTVLGCHDTSTTHTMDISNARPRQRVKHTWKCTCGAEMNLGPKQHTKMTFDNETYRPRNQGCKRNHPSHTYTYAGQHNPDAPKKVTPKLPPLWDLPPVDMDELTPISTDDWFDEEQMTAPQKKWESGNVKPIVEEVTITKPTKATSHNRPTGTKKERAKVIFAINSGRKDFIARCIDELDMTKAGASTYHSNFKKGAW